MNNELNKSIVIYTRFSSDQQKEESCVIQEKKVRAKLEGMGIETRYAKVIRDEAISGSRDDRPGFQEMLKLMLANKISVIGINHLSRLSRGSNTKSFIEDLIFHGGRLITVVDGIDSNSSHWEIQATVGELHNSQTLKDIATNVRDGIEERVETPIGSAGDHPYGYRSKISDPNWEEHAKKGKRPPRDLFLYEPEVFIVRRIYHLYVIDHYSLSMIAKELNRIGAPKNRRMHNRVWSHREVLQILRNSKYIGRWRWGEKMTIRDSHGKKKQIPSPDERKKVYSRPTLRIISDELWQGAQARRRIAQDRVGKDHPRHQYPPCLIGGLFCCEACGRKLNLAITMVGGKRYRNLFCRDARYGGCSMRWMISVIKVEKALFAFLRDTFGNSALFVDAVYTAVAKSILEADAETPGTLLVAKQTLVEIERKIANIAGFIENGSASRSLQSRLGELEHERSLAHSTINECDQTLRLPSRLPPKAWVHTQLQALPELLKNGSPAAADIFKAIFLGPTISPVPAKGLKRRHYTLKFGLDLNQVLLAGLGSEWRERVEPWVKRLPTEEGPANPIFEIVFGDKCNFEVYGPQIHELREKGIHRKEIAVKLGLNYLRKPRPLAVRPEELRAVRGVFRVVWRVGSPSGKAPWERRTLCMTGKISPT